MKALGSRRLTRMMGRPTANNINKSRSEIAAKYAKAKTTRSRFPPRVRIWIRRGHPQKGEVRPAAHNDVAANLINVGDLADNW